MVGRVTLSASDMFRFDLSGKITEWTTLYSYDQMKKHEFKAKGGAEELLVLIHNSDWAGVDAKIKGTDWSSAENDINKPTGGEIVEYLEIPSGSTVLHEALLKVAPTDALDAILGAGAKLDARNADGRRGLRLWRPRTVSCGRVNCAPEDATCRRGLA